MLTIREVIKICFNALLQRLKKHRGNWEQNDPTADDYIKNRPFYTDETNHTIILPEQTLSSLEATLKEPLIIGETYVVTFNGTDYKCVCRDYGGYRMLGNNAIYKYDGGITTDTGEPFALKANGDSEDIYFYLKNESEAPIVKIGKAKVVKLDKKYLPDLGLAPVATSGNYNDLENRPTIYTDVVRYNTSQNLSTARKKTAKTNIGAVGYDSTQGLTTANKTQARTNIGAVGYEVQTLTDAQKAQARTNIGAGTSSFDGKYSSLTGTPTLATVATTGSYTSLLNRPTIPEAQVNSDWSEYSEASKAHVKNRPCYDDDIYTKIISNILNNTTGRIDGITAKMSSSTTYSDDDGSLKYYYGSSNIYADQGGLSVCFDSSVADGDKIYAIRYPNADSEYVKVQKRTLYTSFYSSLDEIGAHTVPIIGNPWLIAIYTGAVFYAKASDVWENPDKILTKSDLDNGDPFAFSPFKLTDATQVVGVSLEKFDGTICYVYEYTNDLKQLDEKFIPDTIARISDIPAAVTDDHINELIDSKLSAFDVPDELPTVTTDNNGAFLRVVDGAWAIATIAKAEEADF